MPGPDSPTRYWSVCWLIRAALARLAESLPVPIARETLGLCIMRLIEADEDQVDIMQDLAEGESRAAALALFGLLNTGYTDLAREIFVRRMGDGSLLRMVGEAYTTPFNLVALSGRLDSVCQTNFSRTYFDSIWSLVRNSPTDLNRFLGELLGDPDPQGTRCVPVHSESIPQEIKLMALSLLTSCSATARERSLCFAASDPDEAVARLATTMLIDYWGSQAGCVPENMYFFAMLKHDDALLSLQSQCCLSVALRNRFCRL